MSSHDAKYIAMRDTMLPPARLIDGHYQRLRIEIDGVIIGRDEYVGPLGPGYVDYVEAEGQRNEIHTGSEYNRDRRNNIWVGQ